MQHPPTPLPRGAHELEEILGRSKTLALIGALPRCKAGAPKKKSLRPYIYVPTPQNLKPDHILVRILGKDDALKLCREMGGINLLPPNCKGVYLDFVNAETRRMILLGMGTNEIAYILQRTPRYVRKIKKQIQDEALKHLKKGMATH